MNDPELFELCKQVYEIHPEWNDTGMMFSSVDGVNWSGPMPVTKFAGATMPAYTSDYLLPLLMPHTTIEFVLQSDGNILLLWYPEPFKEATIYASSHLKTLLKLAVALKEAGVEL